MKGILGLLRPHKEKSQTHSDSGDSVFFSTAFVTQGVEQSLVVPWDARAVEVGAKRLSPSKGSKQLQALWSKDKYMSLLGSDSVKRMEKFFDFAHIAAGRELIRQEEHGNYMIVLLDGSISIDRMQPWGEQLRLTEAKPGDILGEMSLLDSGIRFSGCTTIVDCEIAVLNAEGMDEMMVQDPQLAAGLVALLARKLSLRLRAVSTRLSEQGTTAA